MMMRSYPSLQRSSRGCSRRIIDTIGRRSLGLGTKEIPKKRWSPMIVRSLIRRKSSCKHTTLNN